MRRKVSASALIEAPPEDVWSVVSDVTRVGEWSGECQGCEWVPPHTGAVPGARFRGRNRRGGMRWTRLSEVVAADAPNALTWRTIARFPYLDSTEWRLRLETCSEGTQVTESFEIQRLAKPVEGVLRVMMPAHNDRTADLTSDLSRLKALVEAGRGAASQA